MKDLPGDTRATGAGDVPSPSIVPGERSSLCRQREAPTEILSPSPDTVSGAIAPHCPPPMEGAGGGRGSAPGGGGGRRIPFNQRHRRQGGCSIPLPVSPSPTGVIPPRYGVRGKHHLSRFQARNSSQILSPSPDTAIGPIAPYCPPPLEGAGGGRGAAGRWGCLYLPRKKSVWLICRRQGRGMFHPPPRQPLPRGGDSPSIQCPGRRPLLRGLT